MRVLCKFIVFKEVGCFFFFLLVEKLLVAGLPAGITLTYPEVFTILDNKPGTYMQQLTKVVDDKLEIVMVVIPNNKGEHYHAVKKLCCIEKPVPSQVMTYPVLSKERGLGSVASKVAMQMGMDMPKSMQNIWQIIYNYI